MSPSGQVDFNLMPVSPVRLPKGHMEFNSRLIRNATSALHLGLSRSSGLSLVTWASLLTRAGDRSETPLRGVS